MTLDTDGSIFQFLKHFHARFDGSFPDCATTIGASSYELLAQVAVTAPVEDGHSPLRILEVGCGDGRLLQILDNAVTPRPELTGVDLVPEQIERAISRLSGRPVRLLCEASQNMSPDTASFDCVLIHMALAFMQPVGETLAEIDRVLGRGGILAIVAERPAEIDSIDNQCSQIMRRVALAEQPDLLKLIQSDQRVASSPDLTKLIEQTTNLSQHLPPQPFDAQLEVTAETYIEFAEGDYLWPYLTKAGKALTRQKIRVVFDQQTEEHVIVPLAMNLLVFQKARCISLL